MTAPSWRQAALAWSQCVLLALAGCAKGGGDQERRSGDRTQAGPLPDSARTAAFEPWCYLRFQTAKGASFRVVPEVASSDRGCEDSRVVLERAGGPVQAVARMRACDHFAGEKRRAEVAGRKEDRWRRRTWFADVVVQPAGPGAWSAEITIDRGNSKPFPRTVTIESNPLGRKEMRTFLLAVANGDFHASDCKTSAVEGVCRLCDEVRENRARWNDPKQDVLRLLEEPDN